MLNIFVRIIISVLMIPAIIYVLFFYLDKDAWFWAMFVWIGNIMLLVCSPNRKITKGIGKITFLNWIFIIVISLTPIIFVPRDTLIALIIKCFTLFIIFIGFSVFQIRIRELNKIRR
jgi:hypothetical protein